MEVLAVMVRYKTALSASQTIAGVCAAFAADPELAASYRLFIWDNSPEPLSDPELPIAFTYRHSERNLGVSGAYNNALEDAEERGCPWMLLLDQDTTVTATFLRSMLGYARELEGRDEVAAIAPTVRTGDFIVSPRRQLFNRHRAYPKGEAGIAPGEAFAINSGCLLRVDALKEIGGFSTDFWLDYSDMYVFHQLFVHGKKVWRAPEAELEHEMSVMDYDRLMTPWRYRNFSYAETAFNDLYKGRLENGVQNLRLLLRAIKQRIKYENPEFSRIAWEQLLYRLRVRREHRLARWIAEGQERREAGTPQYAVKVL